MRRFPPLYFVLTWELFLYIYEGCVCMLVAVCGKVGRLLVTTRSCMVWLFPLSDVVCNASFSFYWLFLLPGMFFQILRGCILIHEVLAQMLLALKEALLGHPIHNIFFYLIGAFHLQLIENLTNRALSTWSRFFFIEHVQLHGGPSEDQALCISPLLFRASASLGYQIIFMA